jgi:hypothetical protein
MTSKNKDLLKIIQNFNRQQRALKKKRSTLNKQRSAIAFTALTRHDHPSIGPSIQLDSV